MKMAVEEVELPLIDISGYLNPRKPGDKEAVVQQVRDAARQYGFFQVKGHGIPLSLQRDLLRCMDNVFNLPKEQKMKMSFLDNPCRRGYEASGMSHREGDALPDAKECFFVGRDDPVVELSGIYGPNIWPDLPESDFRGPVSSYYQQTNELGKSLWAILLEGLDQPAETVAKFSKRPIVPMKMIRYPPSSNVAKGQFGIGAHTDFGGVTILFQQPSKDGLEVWHDSREEWIDVPALEDIYIINCGDMIQRWSGGAYKSARHRVINKVNGERLSCATFWHGDVHATNPLKPDDPSNETIGQLLAKRFGNQYSFSKELMADVQAAA
ncbi:2OG-Fe(II) oxygenase [Dissoconium aciculare CBS 342.82]|uniref:2OG-Fe(II) oxygenase n=1 Tax=Dissoconium aciculare CBS 342.82 TaxID=1314786 RepID=A0A6J3LU61_9PEZI|nr:2OG-Fe(II) oxygenase [Dissoconium aciculare CBS 342.82]KAF1818157.1 2OG-Fe(II) oxygenase [Dissoconium aciculare CBS 342.82]